MKIVNGFEAGKSALQRGSIAFDQLSPDVKQRIKETFGQDLPPAEVVNRIVAEVRNRGDAAVLDFTRKIDKVNLKSLSITESEFRKAYDMVDPGIIDALNIAAEQIRVFHQLQLLHSVKGFMAEGVGQLVRPLERVGLYVPGGTASYPSTVMMSAIPARVAGVAEIIMATPPGKGGEVPPSTLVAADIAGVDLSFKMGGAQAIAALAFGTRSIPRVDKICGPGNIFVSLAKKTVFGEVAIDGIYGPTETVIVADDSASPKCCAADLLAQAEHDALSAAIMITTSTQLAEQVNQEVESRLASLERAEIARRSLDTHGCIIVVEDMVQAIELVNIYAPEHLALVVRDASSHIEGIRNAGGIFIGESSPEVLGDYVAGPSHVMPTGGSARFNSPLGVNDFIKTTSVVALSDDDSRTLGPAAAAIARIEGLTAHTRAAELRLKKGDEQ